MMVHFLCESQWWCGVSHSYSAVSSQFSVMLFSWVNHFFTQKKVSAFLICRPSILCLYQIHAHSMSHQRLLLSQRNTVKDSRHSDVICEGCEETLAVKVTFHWYCLSDSHYFHCMCALSGGDGWQQPSLLLRHDSVDSGVAKGGHGGLAGASCWKETPSWHGAPRGSQDSHHHQGRHPKRGAGDRDRQGGHRQRNGNFHPRKGTSYPDKFPNEERKDSKDDKLKFVEEDFVSSWPPIFLLHYSGITTGTIFSFSIFAL